MASIVAAFATSHSPLLTADPGLWAERAEQDRSNPELYDHAGQLRTYDELLDAAAGGYDHLIATEVWQAQFERCQRAIRLLAAAIDAASVDLAVVIGDDQLEMFDHSNMPAIALYWGDWIETAPVKPYPQTPYFNQVRKGYAMDGWYSFLSAPKKASGLISALTHDGFDVTACQQTRRLGFGHAYGFVFRHLIDGRTIPTIPILLNTYYPPNQPTPSRCHAFGRGLRRAIETALPHDMRVVVIASGGLSHFVVNEELDRTVLDGLQASNHDVLCSLPENLLNAGSSEIRNWIAAAGAVEHLDVAWTEYVPCYRSAAGTGCGMGFAEWS